MSRLPPVPLPGKRIFAHVLAMDIACPHCGTLHAKRVRRERLGVRQRQRGGSGYDHVTGVFSCRRCQKKWLVGAILYPLGLGRPRRPADTRPTVEEALTLRQEGNWAAGGKLAGDRANLVVGPDEETGGGDSDG